jgi:hypothetical protein
MAEQPSLWAELKAMAREAIKDIREKLVELGWFGQRDGPGEPGTPLNPTPQMVTKDLGTVYGSAIEAEGVTSYQDILRGASQRAVPDQDKGIER